MSETTKAQVKRDHRPSLLAVITLARWNWRQNWYFLFITSIGIIAATMITCLIPLFSAVTTTAGLRSTLNTNAENANLVVNASVPGITTPAYHDIQQQLTAALEHPLHGYLTPHVQFSMQGPSLPILEPKIAREGDLMQLMSAAMQPASTHLTLLQGRLPQEEGRELEAIITPKSAELLKISPGSVITLRFSWLTLSSNNEVHTYDLHIHIVGIFTVSANDSYWHGATFQPKQTDQWTNFSMLTANAALLHTLDTIAQQNHLSDVLSDQQFNLFWAYRLDTAHLTSQQLDDLSQQLAHVQATIADTYGGQKASTQRASTQYPYIQSLTLNGPALDTADGPGLLNQYSAHITVIRIPLAILAFQIIGLIFLFINILGELIVDRQTGTIAILRSRGASGQQIFGSLMAQSLVLGVIALLIGPLLALGMVLLITPHILPAANRDALNVLLNNPAQALFALWWYAALTVLIAMFAIAIALRRAIRMDALAIRRETTRPTQRSIWQRLNLDIIAIIVALTAYGLSLYVTTIGGLLDANTQAIVAAPLALIAPFFLLLAGLLLFMRLFPFLLRRGAGLASHSRGATALLSFAQIARAPLQALRITLLLALTCAFAIFSLIFTVSQTQHTHDIALYQSQADFSGDVSTPLQQSDHSPATIIAAYQHIHGVTAASAGYVTRATPIGQSATFHIALNAVDTQTFAQTASWPEQASTQSLPSLMQVLISSRQKALREHVVPVIVDTYLWNGLALNIGSTFTIHPGDSDLSLRCLVIDRVEHIPPANDSTAPNGTNRGEGGIVTDYQLLNQVVQNTALPINHIWLRAASDSASLASVRTTLSMTKLRLNNLVDRQALILTQQNDPLALNLSGLLLIGTVTALFLALVGNLLVSWANVRARLTNFVVLRALGTTPGQVISILIGEQVITYSTIIVLGTLLGLALAKTVIPSLVFTSVPIAAATGDTANGTFFSTQHILPVQIIVPPSLLLVLLILVGVYIISLGIMVRVISRASPDHILRINED